MSHHLSRLGMHVVLERGRRGALAQRAMGFAGLRFRSERLCRQSGEAAPFTRSTPLERPFGRKSQLIEVARSTSPAIHPGDLRHGDRRGHLVRERSANAAEMRPRAVLLVVRKDRRGLGIESENAGGKPWLRGRGALTVRSPM